MMIGKLGSHARRNLVSYAALTVALALTGTVAYSAIPDANDVIHACYENSLGSVRVIDTEAGATCRPTETALTWNQRGPAGAPGPQGAPGAQGPPGPPGVGTVYARSAAGPVKLPFPKGGGKTLTSFTVPAGSYVITGKAVGGYKVIEGKCDVPNAEALAVCEPDNIIAGRTQSDIFTCTVNAGSSSDLGRATLIAGRNRVVGFQTVSANVITTFTDSRKISLTCVHHAPVRHPVSITNARLIAMKVDQVNPLNAFKARAPRIPKPQVRLELNP